VESTVRRAVGQRADQGAWTISLVQLGSEWQVTIDGPEPLRGISLTVPEIRLHNAIVEAIAKSGASSVTAPGPARAAPSSAPGGAFSVATGRSPSAVSNSPAPRSSPPSAPPAGEVRDKYECSTCGQGFVVVYAKQPGEGTTKAPVACPKCWQVMQVPIALQAAQHEDYRAEAV
jgi:hypothetical protein